MALWLMDIYQIFSSTLSTLYVLVIVSVIILMVLENQLFLKLYLWHYMVKMVVLKTKNYL